MYRKGKFKKIPNNENKSNANKRPLNTIDENLTIKLQRTEEAKTQNANKANALPIDTVEADLAELFSEENIPASQEPTQRYLSQRSIIATLQRTQSTRLTQSCRQVNNYFELVLTKAGVLLDEDETFILSCDHVTFVSKFRDILMKNPNYPDNVETFKSGLRDALHPKSKYMQKLLTGCTINVPEQNNVYKSQGSMITNFLMIDFLWDHVLEVLLERIEEIACQKAPMNYVNNFAMLPMLLLHLRFLTDSHGDMIYTKIKNILDKSKESAKWDIIANAEYIIEKSKHDEFVELLINNLTTTKEFFAPITVQTLTNLCLSSKTQMKLREQILMHIKNNECPNTNLPKMIKFLLRSLCEDNEEITRDLVDTLREILNNRSLSADTEKQIQIELFDLIEQALMRSKKFYTIWQKTIAKLPQMQYGSIDFIITLILMHIKDDNTFMPFKENNINRRIKLGHIQVEIFHEIKHNYAIALEKYSNVLLKLLHDFLKEKNQIVAEFARSAYGILFKICDSVQKKILQKLLQLTCDKSSKNSTQLGFDLLRELQLKYPIEIQNWGMQLRPLLERLDEVTLTETRIIMELICSVAYPTGNLIEYPEIQNQLDMLVKKQLINCSPFIKKQGIIGCVQLIHSIARAEEPEIQEMDDDSNTTFNSITELPEGRCQIAASYIERIHSATAFCPESLSLFYDELATVCAIASQDQEENRGHKLEMPFLRWLCELLTANFQGNFITGDETLEKFNNIELTHQKCINSYLDITNNESELPLISINIAELVFRPRPQASSSILVLAPLFNLVRTLNLQRYQYSLESINALLGCSIVLPTFFNDTNIDEKFNHFDISLQKMILDIYYHCVNWMRIAVSSFASQRTPMIQKKILQRLSDIINLEATIFNLLQRAPIDYVPPMCQFITSSSTSVKSTGFGKTTAQKATNNAKLKRGKPTKTQNETELHNDMTNDSINPMSSSNRNDTIRMLTEIGAGRIAKHKPKIRRNFKQFYGSKEIYRQMDSEIMLILEVNLNINYPLPAEEIGLNIGLPEFHFILYDLVGKLESIIGCCNGNNQQNVENQQYIAKPDYFMFDLSKFLSNILKNMKMIGNKIDKHLETVNKIYSHADLFTDSFCYLRACFGLCLRLLSSFFSWTEFHKDATGKTQLLTDSLYALLDQKKPELRHKNPSKLARIVFEQTLKYESSIVDLKTAVDLQHYLIMLKKIIINQSNDQEITMQIKNKMEQQMRTQCKILLCRKWFGYDSAFEKGAACNLYLNELFKGFLKKSDFQRQKDILQIVLEENEELKTGQTSALKSFPNITKANFPLLYRDLCETFIKSVNHAVTVGAAAAADDELHLWETSCSLLNTILEILIVLKLPTNYQIFLKHAHIYLKLFIQRGLQHVERFVRVNPERVSAFLKSLQSVTRYLHTLCCQSKMSKTTTIVNRIPAVRETVETLVFRVKAIMAVTKCSSAFWMGNLVNKDVNGVPIQSQCETLSSDVGGGENSDEELPPDDESIDETIYDADNSHQVTVHAVNTNGSNKSSSRSTCF